MRSKIKIGIAGCGNSAKNIHYKKLKSASDFFEVAAVFDLDLTRAEEIGKLYGAKAYGSLKSFLNHPGMEPVLVATKPAATHTKIGLAALIKFENGKTGIASMRTVVGGEHPRFSVMGETGGCSWPAGNAQIIKEENRLLIRVPEIHRGRRENPTASFEAKINFTPFYNNLYEALKGDAQLLVKPGEALAAVCATSAAIESCLTGRAVSLIHPEQPKP